MTRQMFAWGLAAWIGCIALSLPIASRAQTAAASTIALTVGGQRTLALGAVPQRIAIGDPSVADVLIVKGDRRGSVLLVGKAAGSTDVMVWSRGSDAPVTYRVDVQTDASRALLGADTPAVRVLGKTALITGSSATMEQHQRAVVAAQGSLDKDGTVFDTSTIATRAVVQVDVRVVEFSRSVLKQAGFNFFKQNNNGFAFGSFGPSALNSATIGPVGLGSMNNGPATAAVQSGLPISSAFNLVFGSGSHSLLATLSLLQNNNLARILAEPTLVALSGQSASFLAGGEIPVPVPEALGSTSIEYKPYGIGLSLTPTVLSPERIALKVAPEASELDFVHAVTISGVAVPAITTRRADTTVELGDGESFVIGGLIDRETASNVDKVPLLGDLPIIGAFFKQLSYQQTDKELVIIVTPHLVSPLAKGATLPATPGEQTDRTNAPVWRAFLGGVAARDAVPGFTQ